MDREELREELNYNLDEKTKFIIKQTGSTYEMFKKFEDKVIELSKQNEGFQAQYNLDAKKIKELENQLVEWKRLKSFKAGSKYFRERFKKEET